MNVDFAVRASVSCGDKGSSHAAMRIIRCSIGGEEGEIIFECRTAFMHGRIINRRDFHLETNFSELALDHFSNAL